MTAKKNGYTVPRHEPIKTILDISIAGKTFGKRRNKEFSKSYFEIIFIVPTKTILQFSLIKCQNRFVKIVYYINYNLVKLSQMHFQINVRSPVIFEKNIIIQLNQQAQLFAAAARLSRVIK